MASKRKASNDPTASKSTKRQGTLFSFIKNTPSTTAISVKSSAESSPQKKPPGSSSRPHQIYCDLDGVLCDFDAGVRQICNGKNPNDVHPSSRMWASIARSGTFYRDLPWMPDGKQLWDAIQIKNPHILTGIPTTKNAREQKVAWCTRELTPTTPSTDTTTPSTTSHKINHVDMAAPKRQHACVKGRLLKEKEGDVSVPINVITCWSKNKHFQSKKNAVLIDDRETLGKEWEEKGGIFIHHVTTENTLELLKSRGILADTATES